MLKSYYKSPISTYNYGYANKTSTKEVMHENSFKSKICLRKPLYVTQSTRFFLHLTKDESNMAAQANMSRQKWRQSKIFVFILCYLSAHTISCSLFSIPQLVQTSSRYRYCNDHIIEEKESNLMFSWNEAAGCVLCLMLDSLVSYERDKRNFVHHNYNGW